MTGGDPAEVIVTVNAAAVEVTAFAARWNGPVEIVPTGRPVETLPLPASDETALLAVVKSAIEQARHIRLATYRSCSRCGKTKPPEWMHDQKLCQECAARFLGVVY